MNIATLVETYLAWLELEIGLDGESTALRHLERTKLFEQRIDQGLAALERASPGIRSKLTAFPGRPFAFTASLTEEEIRAIWPLPELRMLSDRKTSSLPALERDEHGCLPFIVTVLMHIQAEDSSEVHVERMIMLIRSNDEATAKSDAVEQCGRSMPSYFMGSDFRIHRRWWKAEHAHMNIMHEEERTNFGTADDPPVRDKFKVECCHLEPGREHRSRILWKPTATAGDMAVHGRVIDFENDLLARYRQEHSQFKLLNNGRSAPEWAFQIAPAIPFVGRAYGQDSIPPVLIYASAENLSYILKEDLSNCNWLKDEAGQMRRSRLCNEVHHGTNIHIGPINDGTELKVARHILECLRPPSRFAATTSEDFLEQVAVANPGKYSILSATNKDYPKDLRKFQEMVPYILADLDVLRPEILIIPRSIFNTLRRTALRDRLADIPTIVLISQVQPRPIRTWRKAVTPKDKWCLSSLPYNWNVPAHADQYVQWIEERKESIAWHKRVIQL